MGGVRESNESYVDHKLSCVCTNLLQELLKSEKDMTVIVILGSSSTLSSMSSKVGSHTMNSSLSLVPMESLMDLLMHLEQCGGGLRPHWKFRVPEGKGNC